MKYIMSVVIICGFFAACGGERTERQGVEELSNQAPQLGLLLDSDSKGDLLFVFPGWGYDLLRRWERVMFRYEGWFEEEIYGAGHVYRIEYPYTAGPEELSKFIAEKMQSVLATYPEGTRYDVVGHSFGGFAGLYAPLVSGLGDRLNRYISVAGVQNGMDSKLCERINCGASHKFIVPYQSQFIQDFHQAYDATIKKIKMCALYSPADRFVKPYDAPKVPPGYGINVEVPRMGHLRAVSKRRSFDALVNSCYQ